MSECGNIGESAGQLLSYRGSIRARGFNNTDRKFISMLYGFRLSVKRVKEGSGNCNSCWCTCHSFFEIIG